jgi:hypothetical protein
LAVLVALKEKGHISVYLINWKKMCHLSNAGARVRIQLKLCEGLKWKQLAPYVIKWWAFVNTAMSILIPNSVEFVDNLRDYQLLKTNPD